MFILPAVEPSIGVEAIVKKIRILHEQIKKEIANQNTKYQKPDNKSRKGIIFKEGDLVLIMRKEKFSSCSFGNFDLKLLVHFELSNRSMIILQI